MEILDLSRTYPHFLIGCTPLKVFRRMALESIKNKDSVQRNSIIQMKEGRGFIGGIIIS